MTQEQLTELANGNEHAAQFLAAYQERCHLLDDLEDRDKPVSDVQMIQSEVDWLMVVTANPFFLQYKAQLVPLITLGAYAWLESNAMKNVPCGTREQAVSDILKSQYSEVAWWVAFLTGGEQHMRNMTAKYRAYDFEEAN